MLASSAKPEELEHYLTLLDARSLVDGWTDSGDVEQTKPEPDLVLAALEKAGAKPKDAVMIGDSVWDCRAAKRARVRSIGVLTGGFSEARAARGRRVGGVRLGRDAAHAPRRRSAACLAAEVDGGLDGDRALEHVLRLLGAAHAGQALGEPERSRTASRRGTGP